MIIDEVDDAVDAAIGAFFAGATAGSTDRTGTDKGERPPFKLEAVGFGEIKGGIDGFGFTFDGESGFGECIFDAIFDEGDGEMGDVDADPAAIEGLGSGNGGATATEGVEDDVTGVG